MLGGGGVGAVIVALINKFRAPEDRRAVNAAAARDEATAQAAVIASMGTAFTGTTGALREEIERMQDMLDDMRRRVVEAEAEIRAAAAREASQGRTIADQARVIADQKTQLGIAHGDVMRLRAERDAERERADLHMGEVRQLQQLLNSTKALNRGEAA